MAAIAAPSDPRLIVGPEHDDDAAVYYLTDNLACVVTADFFTPVVDDPFDFGRIAAANALSDIYAMGATPCLALNLMAFPKALGLEAAGAVLRGAAQVVAEASAIVAGGHTIEDNEPKFGLSVVGIVDPAHVLRNGGAKPGDVLFLTKPVGTGLMTTGLKRGRIDEAGIRQTVECMATLNARAAEVVRAHAREGFVHALTDLTGFGLAGHVHEMCAASGCAAVIEFARVPLLDGAYDLAKAGVTPGKTRDVRAWAEGFCEVGQSCGEDLDAVWNVLADPQTSGGLLVAVDPDDAQAFEADLVQSGALAAARIGCFEAGDARVLVR